MREIDAVFIDETETGYRPTGDPLVDRWMERLSRGEDIDLTERIDPGTGEIRHVEPE